MPAGAGPAWAAAGAAGDDEPTVAPPAAGDGLAAGEAAGDAPAAGDAAAAGEAAGTAVGGTWVATAAGFAASVGLAAGAGALWHAASRAALEVAAARVRKRRRVRWVAAPRTALAVDGSNLDMTCSLSVSSWWNRSYISSASLVQAGCRHRDAPVTPAGTYVDRLQGA